MTASYRVKRVSVVPDQVDVIFDELRKFSRDFSLVLTSGLQVSPDTEQGHAQLQRQQGQPVSRRVRQRELWLQMVGNFFTVNVPQ